MPKLISLYMANLELTVDDKHIKNKYSQGMGKAIMELICNSLDADANRIDIQFIKNDLGGIERIIIQDNGIGMSYMDANMNFRFLGNSYKSTHLKTPSGRVFLGKKGEGRLFALGIGSRITWLSTYRDDATNKIYEFKIVNENSSRNFVLDDSQTESTGTTGMKVIIEGIDGKSLRKFRSEKTRDDILYELAYYLKAYEHEDIQISYDEETLCLKDALKSEGCTEIILIEDPETSNTHQMKVQLLHWKDKGVHGRYFLNNENEITYQDTHTGVMVQDFGHSVFVSGDIINQNDNSLALLLQTPLGNEISKGIREVIQKYHLGIYKKEAAAFVTQIKEEDYYPYRGEPQNAIEQSERDIFDVALFEVATNSRQFSKDSAETKAIVANLLKTTIQRDVKDLIPILEETLKLPDEEIGKFRKLIESYGLPHLINTTKSITDKLSFIDELNALLHNPKYQKITLERKHIHRILENELWIFGDGYIGGTSDQVMKDVLKNHLKFLGRSDFIGEDIEGLSADRPDIMLNKQYPQTSEGKFEHLVVELKRPSLKITQTELSQIQNYAAQVSCDGRFDTTDVKWKFILVGSNGFDPSVEQQRNQRDRPKGLTTTTSNYEIWIFTWGEILQGLRWKFDYLYNKLKESTPDPERFTYLSENYPDIFRDIEERASRDGES